MNDTPTIQSISRHLETLKATDELAAIASEVVGREAEAAAQAFDLAQEYVGRLADLFDHVPLFEMEPVPDPYFTPRPGLRGFFDCAPEVRIKVLFGYVSWADHLEAGVGFDPHARLHFVFRRDLTSGPTDYKRQLTNPRMITHAPKRLASWGKRARESVRYTYDRSWELGASPHDALRSAEIALRRTVDSLATRDSEARRRRSLAQ